MPWGFVHFIDPREHFAHDQVSQGKLVLSKRSEKEWFWKTLWWPIYIYIYIYALTAMVSDSGVYWRLSNYHACRKTILKGLPSALKCDHYGSRLCIILRWRLNNINFNIALMNWMFIICIEMFVLHYVYSPSTSLGTPFQLFAHGSNSVHLHGQDNLLFLEFTVHWLSPLGCGGMGDLTANVVPACA